MGLKHTNPPARGSCDSTVFAPNPALNAGSSQLSLNRLLFSRLGLAQHVRPLLQYELKPMVDNSQPVVGG
jgi:hypothetical protein